MVKDNRPDLWLSDIQIPRPSGHKYHRGHGVILGADELTGATRLAAEACSRIGAGLTTVISSELANIYRLVLPADIMVREVKSHEIKNVAVLLAGPGGANNEQKLFSLENEYNCARVLDANAIPNAENFSKLDGRCVLTPHEGEFEKLFSHASGSKVDKAIVAAKQSGAIIVLKGEQTVIASPKGYAVLNKHASPWLAKAGTGDVLAGIITGLIAQEMMPFQAACAACWIHGEAGLRIGPGLIASDIEKEMKSILKDLLS